MHRNRVKADEWMIAFGATCAIALALNEIGWYTEVPITPQWAAEQIEHS
jgi:hypothetical protein